MADRLTVGVAARMSRYLQVLTQARKMGKTRISSQEIAEYTNINATQIRRDLSTFGKFGKRGVGYNIDSLLGEIRKILRTQGQHNIALIGAGRLGEAIASSPIFAEHGINIAAVFDTDAAKIGAPIGNTVVLAYDRLPEVVPEKNIVVGVLAVPATAAQQAADDLVASGVKIIFNYSEALLETPSDVTVHTSNPAVDLLYALYFNQVRYDTGFQLGLIAFTAAVLGGIGNLPGAVLGSLAIGFIQAFNEGLTWHSPGSDWTQSIVFSILILILVFRPEGLLGERTARPGWR